MVTLANLSKILSIGVILAFSVSIFGTFCCLFPVFIRFNASIIGCIACMYDFVDDTVYDAIVIVNGVCM